MRLICTLYKQEEGAKLSHFLASKGIANELEMAKNSDWGSDQYGDVTCKVWIYDEDQLQKALECAHTFQESPDDPKFDLPAAKPTLPSIPQIKTKNQDVAPAAATSKKTYLTTLLLFLCIFIFIADRATTPSLQSIPNNVPITPLLASPIKKVTMYDYPVTFELVNKFVKLYGIHALENPLEMTSEQQYLFNKIHTTPYWQGIYDIFVDEDPSSLESAPLFEKIRQGEIWRLFTPCLVHNDILHILFNMLWLIVLSKQMEQRLKLSSFILFILITGIFSNTCQYLMGGANFIGFSGVLCAMLTFIWMRQRVAPWEGYPLEKSTINFILLFIFAMAALQVVSFYLEVAHHVSIAPGIANTAHLSGALSGLLLGRLRFFSWKI